MEEESFDVRVKRLFGTVSESSFPVASWSVADGEVERREWNRERGGDDREDTPSSSSFHEEDGFSLKRSEHSRDRRKEFEDDQDEGGDSGAGGGEDEMEGGGTDAEREEREIRSSIGLDPTLDNEDEEDEYDRVALCRETAGERLYMSDIKDHDPYLSFPTVVPDLFEDSFDKVQEFNRDPRADHFAASARLKEDKKDAESRSLIIHTAKGSFIDSQVKAPENGVYLKPILKRKEGQIDSKPKKRVRFDPGYIDNREDGAIEDHQDFHMVPDSMETTTSSEVDSSWPEESSGVPDYLCNPSKYTHYTFDLSEKDEAGANKCAFEDFRNLVKSSNSEKQSDIPLELPRTVAFTPRKKAMNATPIYDGSESMSGSPCKESDQVLNCSVGLLADEALESEAFEMEEDDVETCMAETSVSTVKDRQYRSKSTPAE